MNNTEQKDRIVKLKELRDTIEVSDILHHREVLRILKENNCSISSNRNGSFINLTSISDDIINKINKYFKHVQNQENELKEKFDAQEIVKQQFIIN
tara:strand:+ start:112 stop:399 length:288 start_codon:yes stop_codon:yes gene_type:complete